MGISIVFNRLPEAIRRFGRNQRGTAAIEFAMILPVLSALIIPLVDVANFAIGVSQMYTTNRSVIQYAMNDANNADMSAARNLGLASWSGRPADGTLSAVMACQCSALAHDCNTPCPDNNPPQSFVTVTSSATFTGNVFSMHKSVTSEVRVR
jgi:Flp pilus assembly protein TadG